MKMSISKFVEPDMTIETVLTTWPYTTPLFQRYRLACVGCSLTTFCTIREMTSLYKVAEDEFITALQQIINEHEAQK